MECVVAFEVLRFQNMSQIVDTYFIRYPAAEYAIPKPDGWDMAFHNFKTHLYPPESKIQFHKSHQSWHL